MDESISSDGVWSLVFLLTITLILLLIALALPGKRKEPKPPDDPTVIDYVSGGGNDVFNQLVSNELLIGMWYLNPVIDTGTYKVVIYQDKVIAVDLEGGRLEIETVTNFRYGNQYMADFGSVLLVRGSPYIFTNIDGEQRSLTSYKFHYNPVKPILYRFSFNIDTLTVDWVTESGDMVLYVPSKLYSLLKNVPPNPHKIGNLSQVTGNSWMIRLPVVALPDYNINSNLDMLPKIYYDYLRGYIWGSYNTDKNPVNNEDLYSYIWLDGRVSLVNHIIRLGLTFPEYRYLDLYYMESLIGKFGNFEGYLGKLFNITR